MDRSHGASRGVFSLQRKITAQEQKLHVKLIVYLVPIPRRLQPSQKASNRHPTPKKGLQCFRRRQPRFWPRPHRTQPQAHTEQVLRRASAIRGSYSRLRAAADAAQSRGSERFVECT